jgi:hypothetical protein
MEINDQGDGFHDITKESIHHSQLIFNIYVVKRWKSKYSVTATALLKGGEVLV